MKPREFTGNLMRHWIRCVAMLVMLPLAACNTMEGFGEDVQSAGQHIEQAAE
jgi:predicted small secreted protein